MPPETAEPYVGEVKAYVNHGRWIAECPSGCGHALVVSEAEPVYICLSPTTMCPDPKVWHQVKFPWAKKIIERELLKRPARAPLFATTRNWNRGETVRQLQAENRAQGIS
tara:strand:- start:289 stop:618 length:330 start_codon:yes stop_codon:yes gene_type:complete